jgi:TolA-binding protein
MDSQIEALKIQIEQLNDEISDKLQENIKINDEIDEIEKRFNKLIKAKKLLIKLLNEIYDYDANL